MLQFHCAWVSKFHLLPRALFGNAATYKREMISLQRLAARSRQWRPMSCLVAIFVLQHHIGRRCTRAPPASRTMTPMHPSALDSFSATVHISSDGQKVQMYADCESQAQDHGSYDGAAIPTNQGILSMRGRDGSVYPLPRASGSM
jgi:hypothetical protein